jgi:hypothetical protein
MSLIVQNPISQQVIAGSWIDESVTTPASTGGNVNHDDGIFSSVTSTIEARTWSFLPNLAFADAPFTQETVSDAGGVRMERVSQKGASRIYKLNSSISGGVTEYKFHGFQNGTYGKYVSDIIIPLMEAEGAELGLFNEAATQWNRNCWGFQFDLTGIITRSSYWGGWTKQRGGFAITPRHVVCARHYQIGIGQQVRFIIKGATPAEDVVVTKTLVDGMRFPNQATDYDNYIYLLDSDLPAGITPLPFSGFQGRAPTLMCGQYSDLILLTASDYNVIGSQSLDWRFQRFTADGFVQPPQNRTGLPEFVAEWMPFFENCHPFIRPIMKGDSGSPINLKVIDSETIAFSKVSSGGTATSCNAAIAAVDAKYGISTGLTVTVAPDPTI